MGLRILPGDTDFSYSGFAAFRRHLAYLEGFNLDEMKEFGGDTSWDAVHSTLRPLLEHSDCDGYLSG